MVLLLISLTCDFLLRLHPLDPLIMYAICLHKYANDMTDMIRVAKLAIESNLIPPEDAIPPMPDMVDMPKFSGNFLNVTSSFRCVGI